MKVIGVMSGTSLDGLDMAYCRVNTSLSTYELIECVTIPYPEEILDIITEAYHSNSQLLNTLDRQYTTYLGTTIQSFIDLNKKDVDLICSHGHTIFHEPENNFTFQIGNLSLLADLLNLDVVCDFRTQDVHLGGQGAPLVPMGDQIFFSEFKSCLNLGGFSNVSFIRDGKRIAFDISPCNLMLNEQATKLGFEYDNHGDIARSGRLIKELFRDLNQLAFYQKKPPKSLGREWISDHFQPILRNYHSSVEDISHTLCHHIGHQIGRMLPKGKCLVTGGGAYNSFLIEKIMSYSDAEVILPSKDLIEFKEALIFALLGVLRYENKVNVLASVTGAKRDHSSGQVYECSKNH